MYHVPDGITYAKPQIYKCKVCGKRLTPDEYKHQSCKKE